MSRLSSDGQSYGATDGASGPSAPPVEAHKAKPDSSEDSFSYSYNPTKWVDLISLLPCIFFAIYNRSLEGPFDKLTWEKRDYMSELWSDKEDWDGPNKGVFVFYTFDAVLTMSVVVYHIVVARHPKYYASRGNRISIIAHIIGGTAGILGLFLGLVTGEPILTVGAIVTASVLHLPSVYWQLRSVHGHREVIIPSYAFIAFGLANCYFQALTRNLPMREVVKCGMCLHIFSWCRLLLWLSNATGMSGEDVYDRMVIFAGMAHLCFVSEHWAGVYFVLYVFWWNFVFNILKPFPRDLLSVNRGFHDVFNDTYRDPDGYTFSDLYERHKEGGMDDLNAVQHAAYDMLRQGNNQIVVEDVARLIESWGVPRSDICARELFWDADQNRDGVISFEEFTTGLWFIWVSIRDSGEMDTRAEMRAEAKARRVLLTETV